MENLHGINYYCHNPTHVFSDFCATHYCCLLCQTGGTANIHNAWPYHHFQDLSQTPCRQNPPNVRAVQDAYPSSSSSTSSSSFRSVASSISEWEQRFPVDSSRQTRYPGTPQCRSQTPTPCHGTSSVGRRRGQRWVKDTEAPAATLIRGLDLEAGTRVSVC